MNNVDYITSYWHYADMKEDKLLNYIGNKQADLSDELQNILNHFRSIQLSGNISRTEVNRLHHKIDHWQKAGYDVGEFKLIMRDLDNRTRIKGNEALFAFLLAAFIGFYLPVMDESRKVMLDVSQEAYRREFAAAKEITGKGRMNPPGASTVTEWLKNPIPSGGMFEADHYADAAYRARQFQKLVNAEKQQMGTLLGPKKPLDIDNPQYKRALEIQKAWYLRRTTGAYTGKHAGMLDMYIAYGISKIVLKAFRDAGVKKYQFIATIDERTTDECRGLHLKIFPTKGAMIGINAPPIYPPPHPCRSIIRAVE